MRHRKHHPTGICPYGMFPTSDVVGITAPISPCFYARPFARCMRHKV
jgi:hypothetical protein